MISNMTALRQLKDRIGTDSLDFQFWLRYSKASYYFYRYEEAKSSIDKAIKLSPAKAELYFEKGLLYNRINELEPSLLALEKAVSLKPSGNYYYWKGIVNQQLRNLEAAESDYDKALEYKFETAELYNNFAILLAENTKYEKALGMINKAILLNNQYAQAYSARSKFNCYLLNMDAACADKEIAIKMGYYKVMEIPDSVCKGTSYQKLKFGADLCAYTKSYQQGILGYTKLIEINALISDNFLNRGYCYFQLKDYANAEKDYLKALTLPNPARDILYDNLSLLYSDQHNYLKSIEYSNKRIELNPANHVPYLDRGFCYRKIKNYKEAEKDFNKSLQLKPDFFRAFAYRSFLFYELEQYDKAYEDALRSVELNPTYGYGYIVLAQVKHQLGMPDFCADLFKARQYGEPEMAENGIKEYCK